MVIAELPQYEKLRLPTSPRYFCSIWYEVQDECPLRKDAKKSSLQAVSQTMAPAWEKRCSSLVILQLNLQTPPAQPQPTPRDRGTQKSSLTLLFPGCFEACGAGVQRAYDEKAEQKKLISTEAF